MIKIHEKLFIFGILFLFFFVVIEKTTAETNGVPMHRLYNLNSGEHFYTKNTYEKDALVRLGWAYEGTGWIAPRKGNPAYRLYNPNSGNHFYTVSRFEKETLEKVGWNYEGIGWNSGGNVFLYRNYNPNATVGTHNYTTNIYEAKHLANNGWRDEGVAWNGLGVGTSIPKATQSKPVYYSQLNPAWSNLQFNSFTIGQAGCVPTSLAMVFNGCYNMNLGVVTIAQTMDGLSSYSFGASGRDLIHTVQAYGHDVEKVTGLLRLKNALYEGYPAILFVNVGIGHSVVAYGYNNGTTEVFDPWNNQTISGWVSIESLWNSPSPDAMDWDAGRPVFVIK